MRDPTALRRRRNGGLTANHRALILPAILSYGGAEMALYGIVIGDGTKPGTFAFRWNQREAKAAARQASGRVYVMHQEPEVRIWDAATFMTCAEFVVSYEKNAPEHVVAAYREHAPGRRRRRTNSTGWKFGSGQTRFWPMILRTRTP